MPNLKQVIESEAALSQYVADSDYEEIAEWLNEKPMIDNPVAEAPLIPKPVSSQYELFAIALSDSLTKDANMTILGGLKSLIELGDTLAGHTGIGNQGNLSGLVGLAEQQGMDANSVKRLRDRLAETISDPSWQAQIEGPSRAELAEISIAVTPEQVQEALNNVA